MEKREQDSKISNPNTGSKPTGSTNTRPSSKSDNSASFDQKKDRPDFSPNQGDQGRTSGSSGYEADKNKNLSRDSQSNDKKTGNKSPSSSSAQQGKDKNTGSKL